MKKILSLFIVMLLMLGMLSACSGESKTWDEIKEDVNLLVENGFVIIDDDTPEHVEIANSVLKTELKFFYNLDIDFLITNVYMLQSQENTSETIGYYKFDDKNDVKKIYKMFVDDASESQKDHYMLFGDILCITNSDRAKEILNY